MTSGNNGRKVPIWFLLISCVAVEAVCLCFGENEKTGKKPAKESSAAAETKQADAAPFQGAEIKDGAVYRGNLRRSGVFNRTGLTEAKAVRWKSQIGGKINSSPVVWKDTLYIGGGDGFYALNTADGKTRWNYPVKGGVDSSACVADDIVCFTTTGVLIALNVADGSLKWKYQGKPAETSRGSPAIAYGAVFTPLGKEIVAVGLNDGKRIWTIGKNVPDEYSSLALDASAFYGAGTIKWGYLYSYDYDTATVNWQSNVPYEHGAGVYFYKTPAVDENGAIYVNTTRGARKFSPTAQGKVAKGYNQRLWGVFLLDKEVDDNEMIPHSCPSVWKDRVYVGRYDGQFFALDAKDGSIVWKKKFPASILSDPSIAAKSGLVCFGCYDGQVYALDLATGKTKWQFKIGDRIFASPWIGDGVIYVAAHDGCVYAIE
ncbi:MAG: PQQ-binding-like beta-propeller repeat protein [Planctomycetes bacterium]|nr:PQQ-binding-like beta-propeller repeat protein [Planctomycetota bacterium]